MQKRLLSVLLGAACCVSNAYATLPGFYMGLMLGPSKNNSSNAQVQALTTPPSTVEAKPATQQFGSRIYMGYKASQNFGAELGLAYFSGIKYDTGDANTCSTPNIRVRDFDFLGVASYPITRSFDVYGKAGAAMTYMTTSGCFNVDLGQECGKSTYTTQVKPAFSAGVSYDMSQNWVVDASWNRVMVPSPVNSMDMYALGISYHFVDMYCGQFLC